MLARLRQPLALLAGRRHKPLPVMVVMSLFLFAMALTTYNGWTTDRFVWDLTITQWLQEKDPNRLWPLPDLMFWMGVRGVAGVLYVAIVGLLWIRGHRAESFFLALVAIPDGINLYLREFVGRPRPPHELVSVVGGPQGFSFPSGTSLHMLLFYGFLMHLLPRVIPWRPLVMGVLIIFGVYIPLMGLWLIHAGRHWPSDVLGGYIFGGFYLFVLITAYTRYHGRVGASLARWTSREGRPRLRDLRAWISKSLGR